MITPLEIRDHARILGSGSDFVPRIFLRSNRLVPNRKIAVLRHLRGPRGQRFVRDAISLYHLWSFLLWLCGRSRIALIRCDCVSLDSLDRTLGLLWRCLGNLPRILGARGSPFLRTLRRVAKSFRIGLLVTRARPGSASLAERQLIERERHAAEQPTINQERRGHEEWRYHCQQR